MKVLYKNLEENSRFVEQIVLAAELIKKTVDSGGKILIFGNGGSATDAQHLAAELVCKFEKVRKPIAALALTADSAILTAQSNDFGFETVFSRQIEAFARPGDTVIGFTTSNPCFKSIQSRNIQLAFDMAKSINGLKRVGFFSSRTKYLLGQVDVAIVVPSESTAITQEVHQFVIHALCGLIEEGLS